MSLTTDLGLAYAEGDQASAARRNATMVLSGKGSEIASVPVVQSIPLYRCLDSSSGYLKDEVYFLAADGLSKKNIRRKHTHSADTDEEGGLLHNAFVYNPRVVVFGQAPFNNLYDFNITTTGNAGFTSIPDSTYGRTNYLTTTWESIGEIGN